MKEKVFQKKVRDFIESNGGYVVNHFANNFTKVGVPDLLVCIKGKFHGIELKTDTGVETEVQAYHMSMVNLSGGLSYILRPTKYKKLKFDNDHDYFQLTFDEWVDEFFGGGV